MFTWDVDTTSADLYVWQCTFKFNHVLEPISPESATAASKMRISCSINLLPRLCFSCLHDWLPTSIFVTADNWNNYWSERKAVTSDSVSYTQAICADPKRPVNPVFCVNDRFTFCVQCTVSSSSSRITELCSFLSCPWAGSHVCDWGSVLHSEPSSH